MTNSSAEGEEPLYIVNFLFNITLSFTRPFCNVEVSGLWRFNWSSKSWYCCFCWTCWIICVPLDEFAFKVKTVNYNRLSDHIIACYIMQIAKTLSCLLFCYSILYSSHNFQCVSNHCTLKNTSLSLSTYGYTILMLLCRGGVLEDILGLENTFWSPWTWSLQSTSS